MIEEQTNIVKKACKELGITYKELGELIGYGESTVNRAAHSGQISVPMQKAIELYLRTLEQEKELQTLTDLKKILQNLVK